MNNKRLIFGIVSDRNGVPRFDDPENAPAEMKAALTDEQLRKMPRDVVEKLGLTHRLGE